MGGEQNRDKAILDRQDHSSRTRASRSIVPAPSFLLFFFLFSAPNRLLLSDAYLSKCE